MVVGGPDVGLGAGQVLLVEGQGLEVFDFVHVLASVGRCPASLFHQRHPFKNLLGVVPIFGLSLAVPA